jgi:hypothetical protein
MLRTNSDVHVEVAVAAPEDQGSPIRPSHIPNPARMYDYCLGGKDNYAADREAVLAVCAQIPEALDVPRDNRLFLYRAVRFLARDAGIRQFIDMGSGLPTQANVHEVARQFRLDARVVYVDNDPVVLAHGRALLANDESTTVITADISEAEKILADPEVRRLIDFSQPVAVLYLSVAHFITDDATVDKMLSTVVDALVPGSYVACSQIVGVDQETVEHSNELMRKRGVPWKNRTRAEVLSFLRGLEPVEPGLVNVKDWRPDPTQPPLAPVAEPLRPYLGGSAENEDFMQFGGVLRHTGARQGLRA